MTERNSTLKVIFINYGSHTPYGYSSDDCKSTLAVPFDKKEIVPNGIKLLFDKFHFDLDTDIIAYDLTEEMFDNIFFAISDVIEHVLENHENKQLILFFCVMDSSHGIIQRTKKCFGHRKYFWNVVKFFCKYNDVSS